MLRIAKKTTLFNRKKLQRFTLGVKVLVLNFRSNLEFGGKTNKSKELKDDSFGGNS